MEPALSKQGIKPAPEELISAIVQEQINKGQLKSLGGMQDVLQTAQARADEGEPVAPLESLPTRVGPGGETEYFERVIPPSKEQQNAAWATRHLTNTKIHGMKESASILQLAKPPQEGGMGFIPGSIIDSLPDMVESEFNDLYSISVGKIMEDPTVQQAVRHIAKPTSEAEFQDVLFDFAVTNAAIKLGRHPDWADPIISGSDDYQYRMEMRQKEDTQRQTERVRRQMEESKPISPEDKAKWSIGAGPTAGLETYTDIGKSGHRLMSETDRKYLDVIDSTLEMVYKVKDMALRLNTSADDYYSRATHGTWLQGQRAIGSEIGIIAKDYSDAAEGIPRLLLPLMGEQGGRFTDKDMQQIVKQIPGGGLFPDGKGVAARKLERLELLLKKKRGLIYMPQIIPTTPPGRGSGSKPTHKVVNGKLVPVRGRK
jgi:hypothetical protein